MTISNIQKEKFLNTLYKNLYSSGNKPNENEILKFFSDYFSEYTPGLPLPINSQIFRQLAYGDVDIFNQKMLYTIFNVETLYDSIFENAEDLLQVATALNKRLETLKAKRIKLEQKVDDLLFANQNSDGYYSVYSDNFSTISKTDLRTTDAFVDTTFGKVSLPILRSSIFDAISARSVISSAPTYSLGFNQTQIETAKQFSDDSFFGSVFDGLENTEWQNIFYFDSIGLVTLAINMPIANNVLVSKIEGKINTISPTDIYAKVEYANGRVEVLSKKSTKDFDRFSFSFEPGNLGSIELFLVKSEPDIVEPARVNKYGYRYGIRDIILSAEYYDKSASYVSNPITLNSNDNSRLVIDAVSIEVGENKPTGSSISYFVARDNPSAEFISDFSWIPISPSLDQQNSYSSVVSFDGSTLYSKKIVENITNESNQIKKIPLASSTDAKTINQQNPIVDLYGNQSIYRIGVIPKLEDPMSSYILDGTNMINGYFINYQNSIFNEIEPLSTWSSIMSGKSSIKQIFTIPTYEISNNSLFFSGPNLSGISVLLETRIYCPNDISVKHLFLKNDLVSKEWDVAIYLNGRVSVIRAGVSSEMIDWNFKTGQNTLKIAIDIPSSSNGSISLMDSKSILDYGLVYNQYYSYVDPMEFKFNRSKFDKVFTIDNYFGNSEIFSRDNIRNNSRIFYYSANELATDAIRFRADFARGSNPLSSPSLDYFKVKFKNNYKATNASLDLISENNSSTSSL